MELRWCSSLNDFAEILASANLNLTHTHEIAKKSQVWYLHKYLSAISDSSFCAHIEENYVSKDYLEDYSTYYSKCFDNISKHCRRVHLFKLEKDKDLNEFGRTLDKFIVSDATEIKQEIHASYLGCIVVRPIYKSIIGHTILRNYGKHPKDHQNLERNFFAVKQYIVHLYGRELPIENTLAFQEQDGNVAACATIAVWCVLQRAAEDYYINLRSPSRITAEAAQVNTHGNRMFPNQGLSLLSISTAIVKSGLEPETRDLNSNGDDSESYLKRLIHAYSPVGIPIILLFYIDDVGHAIAICGYSVRKRANTLDNRLFRKLRELIQKFSTKEKPPCYYADKIDKLYAHDDGFGPFCRLSFDSNGYLNSPWQDFDSSTKSKIGWAVVPTFKQIRITFDEINIKVNYIHLWMSQVYLFGMELKADNTTFIWDIQLLPSQTLKSMVLSEESFDDQASTDRSVQLNFSKLSLPKYVWTATFYFRDVKLGLFMFDSTGLINGRNFLGSLFFNTYVYNKFSNLFTYLSTDPKLQDDMLKIFGEEVSTVRDKILKFDIQ